MIFLREFFWEDRGTPRFKRSQKVQLHSSLPTQEAAQNPSRPFPRQKESCGIRAAQRVPIPGLFGPKGFPLMCGLWGAKICQSNKKAPKPSAFVSTQPTRNRGETDKEQPHSCEQLTKNTGSPLLCLGRHGVPTPHPKFPTKPRRLCAVRVCPGFAFFDYSVL